MVDTPVVKVPCDPELFGPRFSKPERGTGPAKWAVLIARKGWASALVPVLRLEVGVDAHAVVGLDRDVLGLVDVEDQAIGVADRDRIEGDGDLDHAAGDGVAGLALEAAIGTAGFAPGVGHIRLPPQVGQILLTPCFLSL